MPEVIHSDVRTGSSTGDQGHEPGEQRQSGAEKEGFLVEVAPELSQVGIIGTSGN